MFVVATIESSSIKFEELSGEARCCLYSFNLGIALGFQAAYNAVGYALLSSNSF